jgi:Uncharacterized protein conserved in bacteria (DUF2066)
VHDRRSHRDWADWARSPSPQRKLPVLCAATRYFACLALLCALPALVFAGAPSLYTGVVPVNTQSDGERAEALKTALAQVVVKLSGDSAILAKPEVAKAVAGAERYVQQFQYTQDVASDAGQPQVRLSLVAQFDRDAVDQLLRDLGVGHAGTADPAPAAADAPPGTFRVWVGGVNSAEDYARLIGTLSRNELVRGIQVEQARADGIQLRLDVVGPLSRLLEALADGPVRVVNAKPPVAGVDALLGMQQ